MAMAGAGNLTPQEAARRAEKWFGARVDDRTAGKIKIYPKDPDQPMITIPDRWGSGSDRRNAVSRLQRHGLDVVNGQTPPDSIIRPDGRSIDKHLTQKLDVPSETQREDTPVTTTTPANNGHPTPAAMPGRPIVPSNQRESIETLLGMLAEAEQRDKERQAEIAGLRETVDRLAQRVARHDEIEHQNRGRYAALSRRVMDMGARVDSLVIERPMTEAERAEAERVELTNKAIEFLAALPAGVTMAAGSLAASLGMPEKGNALGKMMATAARDGRVALVQVGSQRLYRALPKEEA